MVHCIPQKRVARSAVFGCDAGSVGCMGKKIKERKELCTSDWKQAICLHKPPVLKPKLWFKGRIWASRRENGCVPAVHGFLVQRAHSSPSPAELLGLPASAVPWGAERGHGVWREERWLHPAPGASCPKGSLPLRALSFLEKGQASLGPRVAPSWDGLGHDAWAVEAKMWGWHFRHGWWGCSVFKARLDHLDWHALCLSVQSDRFKTWNVFK